MIQITLFHQEENLIGIQSKGHANYSDKGSDIFCAAVSVLMQSLVLGLSELTRLDGLEIQMDDKVPVIKVSWLKKHCCEISLLTRTIAEALKRIAADNPDYINIQTEEIKQ